MTVLVGMQPHIFLLGIWWRILSLFLFTLILYSTVNNLCSADYYVDPIKGVMSNKGDSENPWSTLEAVFTNKKTFIAGDRIFLRRGFHGGPIVTGNNSGVVTILAQEGHAPVMKWIAFNGATQWALQDVFINTQTAATENTGAMLRLAKSTAITVTNCSFQSIGDPWGWGDDVKAWANGHRGGLEIEGNSPSNVIHGCHFMNTANGLVVEGAKNTIEYCVVENFARDGAVPTGAHCIWQYNLIMNAIVVDPKLHRDSWQAWVRRPGVIIRGNTTITAADLKHPLVSPGCPGFAGWDGPFEGWLFENNVFYTDLVAGIELSSASNCTIIHNTVLPMTSGSPAIRISQNMKGDGGPKAKGNIIFNNIAPKFIITNRDGSSSGENGSNLIYKAAMFCASGKGKFDVHLIAPLAGANPAHTTDKDADGRPRPSRKGDMPDIGAYEYGYYTGPDASPPSTPAKLKVVMVPDIGADLQWTASVDNRAVAGYDIYRNGARVGRARNGPHYFDVYHDKAKVTYSVIAFDRSGNYSGMSAAGSIVKAVP